MLGISHGVARVLAPAAFAFDFAAQMYGISTTPSMADVHNANMSFFSPSAACVGGFFFMQQAFQIGWLVKLWRSSPTATKTNTNTSTQTNTNTRGAGPKKSDHLAGHEVSQQDAHEQEHVQQMIDYVPVYALGNVCIGLWMIFWNKSALRTANIFVIVNSTAQLLYVATRLRKLDRSSTASLLTHVVAKTTAGIGVMDILDNTAAAYFVHEAAPSVAVQAVTGVGFGLAGALSDWILGGSLAYDLVALSIGQRFREDVNAGAWSNLLAVYAAGCATIVVLKNWLVPPYENKRTQYQRTAQEDPDEDNNYRQEEV